MATAYWESVDCDYHFDWHEWSCSQDETSRVHQHDFVHGTNPLIAAWEERIKRQRGTLHEDADRAAKQGDHAEEDEDSNEDGADRIRDHPIVEMYESRRNDDANASERVCKHVQEDTIEDEVSALGNWC